ncbi:MAG: ABC transporter ATP-binding protein [Actinobacteria bacterium]|nr:ABC transporter ATP-binding protein [Actinomycetota bacterium]
MMNSYVIEADNVSKKYCRQLNKSIRYGLTDISKSFIGIPTHSSKLRAGEFWAVNNISFDVKQGESLGIIGPNGSGKSTLLKLLNGIFMPDKGKIKVKGRVGALIEIGAGFHPLLTGRENIYVNGAILGMTTRETHKKFRSIVEFADIGNFLDAPVKTYSSGMYVRLGFAVAVHSEPDILLVDEVLAVGDSVFITKCYQKINEIKKINHTTIILVSHNLATVEKFCDRGIFLNRGRIESIGKIHKVIHNYQTLINKLLDKQGNVKDIVPGFPHCTKEIQISGVKFLDGDDMEKKEFAPGECINIQIGYKAEKPINDAIFQIAIVNREGITVSVLGTHFDNISLKNIPTNGIVECRIDNLPLLLNKYWLTVTVYDKTHNITFDYWNGNFFNKFFWIQPDLISRKMAQYTPIVKIPGKWSLK